MKTSFKWVRPNKCRTRKFRIAFLEACQKWYWDPIDKDRILNSSWPKWESKPLWGYVPVTQMDRLGWVYDYGFRRGYLDITFEWFKKIILERHLVESVLYPRKPKTHRGRWHWSLKGWKTRHGKWRVGTKYRKAEGHGKSEEGAKRQDWRVASGKERDLRRSRYRRGPGKWYKRLRSREHRRWVREQISRENWDTFYGGERRAFVDAWDWD